MMPPLEDARVGQGGPPWGVLTFGLGGLGQP
jgi:hypothetical protein